ncbi:hypothetical protein B5F17_13790 [Butyricicoccus pullicaecorum]|uniref:Manganese catalase n=1 Tax=Butyricicoccus pullicaecorum TaxID=501571 RepID=A0A1Y4L1T7_9FIRM|nr:hypothetical protein B5F17_13790 [Butyricicoccus pullicaecorum]
MSLCRALAGASPRTQALGCVIRHAPEQKARTTYDNLLRLIDDPDVRDPIKFLRQREVVHFQRFGDALRNVQENLDARNYYAYNPEFDVQRLPDPRKRPKI